MRTVLSTLVVLFSAIPAFADRAVVDCGEAARGEVTMTVKNARMSHERAAELAWICFKDRNSTLIRERFDALKVAKSENDNCGNADKLQMLPITSWISDRVDANGQSGGDSRILVREPLTCDGVGTGLFGGYVSGASIVMRITETYKVDSEKSSSKQIVTVSLEGTLDLVGKKPAASAPRGPRTL